MDFTLVRLSYSIDWVTHPTGRKFTAYHETLRLLLRLVNLETLGSIYVQVLIADFPRNNISQQPH